MSSPDLRPFAAAIAAEATTEIDKALACLWFEDSVTAGCECSVTGLISTMQSAALIGQINKSRLESKLAKSPFTVRGCAKGTFRIAASRKADLDKRFSHLTKRKHIVRGDALLPKEQMSNTRRYLEALATQANGCFECGFYDACAVLCRRIIESLLIEAFDKAGHRLSIEHHGVILGFDDIIKVAKTGKHIRLPRGADRVIDKIKEIGDTAAHDRYHITTRQDVEEFRAAFSKTVSQLMALAGITGTVSSGLGANAP